MLIGLSESNRSKIACKKYYLQYFGKVLGKHLSQISTWHRKFHETKSPWKKSINHLPHVKATSRKNEGVFRNILCRNLFLLKICFEKMRSFAIEKDENKKICRIFKKIKNHLTRQFRMWANPDKVLNLQILIRRRFKYLSKYWRPSSAYKWLNLREVLRYFEKVSCIFDQKVVQVP